MKSKGTGHRKASENALTTMKKEKNKTKTKVNRLVP